MALSISRGATCGVVPEFAQYQDLAHLQDPPTAPKGPQDLKDRQASLMFHRNPERVQGIVVRDEIHLTRAGGQSALRE